MPPNDPAAPADGRLTALRLHVEDVDRAARFFGPLLGGEFRRSSESGCHVQQFGATSPAVPTPIALLLTDAAADAPHQMIWECGSPESKCERAVALGARAIDADRLVDPQGIQLELRAQPAFAAGDLPRDADGALGIVLLTVPDPAVTREFLGQLFGTRFHRVGTNDLWWTEEGPSIGVFIGTHDWSAPEQPRTSHEIDLTALFMVTDLERSAQRVRELGGQVAERVPFGPYPVIPCRDDQGLSFGLWGTPE